MKAIRIFIGLIVTAFAIFLMEINKYLIELLGKFNEWLIPQEKKCLRCGFDIEDFNIEFPFCKQCAPEIMKETETEYTPPPEENTSAYIR